MSEVTPSEISEPRPVAARRKLWPVALVIVGLLALATWDALRRVDGSVALRRAAFDGNEIEVRRLVKEHPEWLNRTGTTNRWAGFVAMVTERTGGKIGGEWVSKEDRQFYEIEALGATPLIYTIAFRRMEVTKALLERGADMRINLRIGPPTCFLIARFGDTNLLARCMERGVRLDERWPGDNLTMLHEAALSKNSTMVGFLLDHGLEVNATDAQGITPLRIAVWQRDLTTIRLLLARGADPNIKDNRGISTLRSASETAAKPPGSPEAAAMLALLEAHLATNKPPAKTAP